MTYQSHSKFPWRKTLASGLLVLITAGLTAGLFYSILYSTLDGERLSRASLLLLIVWACVFGALYLFVWIHAVVRYLKLRSDEKSKN